VKGTLLERVPPGVTTSTVPVVAPVGTVVVIHDSDFMVNVAGVPLKVTLVAPVRFVPRILTAEPTPLDVGMVLTKAGRFSLRRKIVASV
jgi:hypothetical protein